MSPPPPLSLTTLWDSRFGGIFVTAVFTVTNASQHHCNCTGEYARGDGGGVLCGQDDMNLTNGMFKVGCKFGKGFYCTVSNASESNENCERMLKQCAIGLCHMLLCVAIYTNFV